MLRLIRPAEIDDTHRHRKGEEPKYSDNGCDIVTRLLGHESKCLECPLPECVEDVEARRTDKAKFWLRHEHMREAYHDKGWTVARIAIEFNVSHRTVQRAVVGEQEVTTCRS